MEVATRSHSAAAFYPHHKMSRVPLMESKTSQYCREQLGIDEYSLSPFRCRSTSPFVPNTIKELLQQVNQNRLEVSFGVSPKISEAILAGKDKLPSRSPSQSISLDATLPELTVTMRSATGFGSEIISSPHSRAASRTSLLLDASRTGAHDVLSSRSTSKIGMHHGGSGTDTPLHTFRDHRLLSSRQSMQDIGGNKVKVARGPSTPFVHLTNHFTKDHLTTMFEEMCQKIEKKATGEAEEKAAAANSQNFEFIIAALVKVPRPVYTLARRYVKDKVLSNAYRMYLKALWKYACGRILVDMQRQRQQLARDAKRKFQELLKLKHIQDAKEKKRRRGDLAVAFFNELMPKKSSNVPPLTESWYRSIQSRFREICDSDKMQLTVRDLSGKVDALILRKIDRDHSGTVDFFELLKIVYPSLLSKDLQAMMRKWDTSQSDSAAQLPTTALLSEESKRQIEIMFRKCDVGSKGVLTKQDMMTLFLPKDWEYDEPLWFEKYFPLPSSVVSFDEFVEMVKFIYPPFRSGYNGSKYDPSTDATRNITLPPELIEAQRRARIPD